MTTSIFDDIQKQSKNIILSKSISHPNFFSRNYIEEAYIRKDFKNIIQKILNGLSEKERKIIQYRFGFFDGQYYSLQEVGDKLNLSRERIRQIEKKALLYLKRNLLIKNFKVSF